MFQHPFMERIGGSKIETAMTTQNRLPGRFLPGAISVLLGLAGSAAAFGQAAPATAPSAPGPVKFGFLQEYCMECHNALDWAGGIAYDTVTEAEVPQDTKLWETTVKKLRSSSVLKIAAGDPFSRRAR